jgi:hypothetical protein
MSNAISIRIGRRGAPALLLALLTAAATGADAQAPQRVPFAAGEILTYRAVSGRFGGFGSGTMRVDGPMEIRGQQAMQLSFDFNGRVGIFKVEDRTRSWITRDGMAALRFERSERSPLGSKSEAVEIFPDELRWEGANGSTGDTACEHPLDELSFIYHVRTLPLRDGDEYSLTHHFDPGRNPVMLKVLRREQTVVPAGTFSTVVVEMRVTDKRVSAMTLFISDDAARIPVRIESSAPWVGSTRLLLQSATEGRTASR